MCTGHEEENLKDLLAEELLDKIFSTQSPCCDIKMDIIRFEEVDQYECPKCKLAWVNIGK